MRILTKGYRIPAVVLLAAGLMTGCETTSAPVTVLSGSTLELARGGAPKAPAVAATDPSYGYQGESLKHVTIVGSGFARGAIAAWERNGIPDPKITVVSTVVVSSTEIEATISIASDADLSLYDVSVLNADKGKGIGTELFEVTVAVSLGTLGGNTQINGATDSGTGVAAVGWSFSDNIQHAVVWEPGSDGLRSIGAGRANAVDVSGTTIAGSSNSQAAVWTNAAGWVRSWLPTASGAPRSEVNAVASDGNANALWLGGYEAVKVNRRSSINKPMLWRRGEAGWTRVALAAVSDGQVRGVNARGQAVGGDNGAAAFWDSLGARTMLPGTGGPATGIDASGTVISGVNSAGKSTKAVYWTAQVNADGSRTWSGPFVLPGGCERAMGVDDLGRMIGHRCLVSNTRFTSAVWLPPYDVATELTGFGDNTDAGSAWGISRGGTRIVGHAKFVGALWEGVLPPSF